MANLIVIPFAYIESANTGVNIRRRKASLSIYLKNCCVALISARKNNSADTDCALVTNIDVPEPYKGLLLQNGILIINQEFDCFNFGDSYRWSLAFYKLCALYCISRSRQYDNYAYCDSDVYIQSTFDDIWQECNSHIMLYDINEGLHCDDFRHFMKEVTSFANTEILTHFGGEFYAGNRTNTLAFTEKAFEVFQHMKDADFVTTHGDEFITSVVAHDCKTLIRNAGAYVFRFWTGTFRMISSCYKTVPVLHFPAEKEYGLLTLYNRYISKGTLPSKSMVYRKCHIYFPSLFTLMKMCIKGLLKIK